MPSLSPEDAIKLIQGAPERKPAPGGMSMDDAWKAISETPDKTAEKPRQAPLDSLWESVKRYGAGAVEGVKSMARQLPGEIGEGIADVGRSLMPTQAGAEAGGRTLGRLGDLGTFASGGLTGPMGMPIPPQAGLARGLDMPGRPPLPPQKPQLALPPPQMGVPGRPPISTGQGMIPQGPGATMTAPAATPGPPRPMMPPRVSPTIPPTSPTMSPRPGPALIEQGAELGKPSQLADAFISNSPNDIDRATARRYRGVVNPRGPGRMNQGGLTTQDMQITTAVDSLIEAKDAIRFRDQAGNNLPAGRTPRNLDEFVQGIDHLKSQIYQEYDQLAQRQGGQGVRVPLAPAAAKLRKISLQPEVRDLHPGLATEAEKMAQQWEQRGSYSPKEMQNVIQHLNEQLSGLQRNPTRETYSHSTMMGQVLSTMRSTLNETMATALQGPQYQGLRSRYAALASVEGDVANALRKQLGKQPGLAERVGDLGFWASALHGVVTMNPKTIGTAAAIKGSQEIMRYLRNPNRAVARLFDKRAGDLAPSMTDRMSAGLAVGVGQLRDSYVSPAGP